tara:strand:+ start:606 stop:854 length:249 start_codon:yes stop_codon:yes gene_type:complete
MKYFIYIFFLVAISCKGDYGCRDESACNYDSHAILHGSCSYPEENYDCSGNCIVEIDCFGFCGGPFVEDECGICDGDGSSCN